MHSACSRRWFNDQIDAYSAKLGGVVPDKSGVPLSSFHFNQFYFV